MKNKHQDELRQQIVRTYQQLYAGKPLVVRAPGRINIIGEHTDYNEGFVMPAAIDKYLVFALGKNEEEGQVSFYSFDLQEDIQFSLYDFATEEKVNWRSYLKGVVAEMQERGYELKGFLGVFGGNIPLGAGLSSSAALCCGLVYGIARLQDLHIPREEIALIAQATEHRIGLNCGLMDQYASLFGKKGRVFRLDCKTLEFTFLPVRMQDYSFVLIHSNIKHELAAGSGYNDRRRSCENVVKVIQRNDPSVKSLRDVTDGMLKSVKDEVIPVDYRRAAYVLAENDRVMQVSEALREGDLPAVGRVLFAAHEGLRFEYEVTVPETDLLVDLGKQEKSVMGARQVGGGFGGCVLFLLKKADLEGVLERITEAYLQRTAISPAVIKVATGSGVETITMEMKKKPSKTINIYD